MECEEVALVLQGILWHVWWQVVRTSSQQMQRQREASKVKGTEQGITEATLGKAEQHIINGSEDDWCDDDDDDETTSQGDASFGDIMDVEEDWLPVPGCHDAFMCMMRERDQAT